MPRSRRPDPKRNAQPVLWAEGRQQPKFDLRAFGRVSLLIAREGVGPLLGRIAQRLGVAGSAVATGRVRIPEHRLGQSGQWLPSHQSVGAGISGFGAICAQAGEMVLPPPAPVEPLAFPDLLSLAPKHRRAVERLADLPKPAAAELAAAAPVATEAVAPDSAAQETTAAEPPPRIRRERPKSPLRDITPAEPKAVDPKITESKTPDADSDLLAIRAMLADVQDAPALPAPAPLQRPTIPLPALISPPPISPAWTEETPATAPVSLSVPKRGKSFVMAFLRYLGRQAKRLGLWMLRHQKTRDAARRLRGFLAQTTARGLGWLLTTLALPYGAFRAAMIHLNGEDLRRWG